MRIFGDFNPRFSPVSPRQLSLIIGFTSCRSALYTAIVNILRLRGKRTLFLQSALAVFLVFSLCGRSIHAQDPTQKPSEKPAEKKTEKAVPPEKVENPAQIELLETSYRFEATGDNRKEVHARVKINSELGVRQFARLNFDYNRSFQSVEIPLVRITHASGGTADILPSAITDNPNPAVVDAPAYQDIRVKSVRILGLEPGDNLEYRVVTTTTNHPLAPNFWLDHSFDRTGVVLEEHFQVVMPSSILASSPLIVVENKNARQQLEWRLYRPPGCGLCGEPDHAQPIDIDPSLLAPLLHPQHAKRGAKPAEIPPPQPPDKPLPPAEYGKVQLLVKPCASGASIEKSGEGSTAETSYQWKHTAASLAEFRSKDSADLQDIPDIEIGKTSYWSTLSYQLFVALSLPEQLPEAVIERSQQLVAQADTPRAKAERIYDFVSQKIRTIDLPLGATGFKPRPVGEILSSGYATPEDKYFLFDALARSANLAAGADLIGPSKKIAALTATPAAFSHLVIEIDNCWLDPGLEVAPFGVLPASYRGSTTLILGSDTGYLGDAPVSPMIGEILKDLPFPSSQKVSVIASLDSEGKLNAKVHYSLRGDNELLLRLAFHQSPKEKWKELAQLLSISDGFRGQVTSVNASDAYATREPFTLDYEINMPKFVDWSKKPVRIPALLPQLGLPDPPAKPVAGAATSPIELGTPLEVETHMTLRLPPGTTAQTPTGTSVQRDYATYASQYSAKGLSISASRHINFLLREIPSNRAVDYNSFLRAVQSDEAQDFTLVREEGATPDKKPSAPKSPTPTQAPAAQPKL
jgi:hypothetical protein